MVLSIVRSFRMAAVMAVKRGAVPDHLVERAVAGTTKFRERLESYRKAFG